MTEQYFPGGSDEFGKLTDDQQLSWLEAQVRAARMTMEELPTSDASDEERRAVRDRKVDLEAALVDLKVKMGLMRPPDDAD